MLGSWRLKTPLPCTWHGQVSICIRNNTVGWLHPQSIEAMLEMPSLGGTHLSAALLWQWSRRRKRSNTGRKSDGRRPGNLSPVGLPVTKQSMLKQSPLLYLWEKAPQRRWWVIRASPFSQVSGLCLQHPQECTISMLITVHMSLVLFFVTGYRTLEISAGVQPAPAIVGCEKFYLCNEKFISFLFCAASRLKALWTKVPGKIHTLHWTTFQAEDLRRLQPQWSGWNAAASEPNYNLSWASFLSHLAVCFNRVVTIRLKLLECGNF